MIPPPSSAPPTLPSTLPKPPAVTASASTTPPATSAKSRDRQLFPPILTCGFSFFLKIDLFVRLPLLIIFPSVGRQCRVGTAHHSSAAADFLHRKDVHDVT